MACSFENTDAEYKTAARTMSVVLLFLNPPHKNAKAGECK